ncbi:MAG: hypothetical protein WB822_07390 [Rhodoplanes sp.]
MTKKVQAKAFSGEVGPGSPQKMRLLKENKSEFRFHRNGIRSRSAWENHVHHFERKTGMHGRRTAAHLDADLDRFEDFSARRPLRPPALEY